jgi:F-type H+-transporting ATPase subunit b
MPSLVVPLAASKSTGIIEPVFGLMLWTLVIFFITFYLLRRFAFGRIAAAIDERRRVVRENLESAERSRAEAQRLLEEYKEQLAAARREASEIVERARRTGEELQRQVREEVQEARERGLAEVRTQIEAETRQSLERIKDDVADLTLVATEKVIQRTLDEAEARRLVDEALAEVDFSVLEGVDNHHSGN